MIPFLDLKKINERFHDEILRNISSVLDSGWNLNERHNQIFCDIYFLPLLMTREKHMKTFMPVLSINLYSVKPHIHIIVSNTGKFFP